MTKKEAEETIAYLKEIFDIVRIVDAEALRVVEDDKLLKCHCYDFWNRGHQCENCISRKVLRHKGQKSKLEYIDNDIFQVIAKYLEVDGKPCVMEMIEKIDADEFVDSVNGERLVGKITGYTEKLYEDVLTGAYNRRYYEDEVKGQKLQAGIAVIDIDDFKIYNDAYGHSAGDMALTTTARVINQCIREDDILIRYGGDEFLLILPDLKESALKKVLQRICEEVHRCDVPGYAKMQLSVSIGGVVTGVESTDESVRRADKMMYLAKNHKNMVVTEHDAIVDGKESFDIGAIKSQILIVDDSDINRGLISEMLQGDYRIIEATNGIECLDKIRVYGNEISLILLDIVMPEMDGFEVLEEMNRRHWIEDIPVIMISDEDSEAVIRKAYEMGVSDYISRPFDAKVVYRRVFNTIKLYAKQRRLVSLVSEHMYEKEKNNRMMVNILSQIVEFRNGESGMHVLHINEITRMLLERLVQKTDAYPHLWEERNLIVTASSLHDIGKIGIDEAILNKPGKLTAEEFSIMKTHTTIGSSMLDNLEYYQDEELVRVAREICRSHHERYDGKGYPDGLKGDEIPISAQLVSVADVYDALTSARVYKPAFSHEMSMEMILNGECGAFNPILIECLVDIQDQLKAMKKK